LDLDGKHSLDTYTAKGKALADYAGRYKLDVSRKGMSTYGTIVPELSIIIALCTI